jgi:hypothetical protein
MTMSRRALVGLAFLLWSRAVAAFPQERVALSVDVSPTVTLHEPVLLTIAIVNDSQGKVVVDMGLDTVGHFEFELLGPDGGRQVVRPAPQFDGVYGADRFILGPKGRTSSDAYGYLQPDSGKATGPVMATRVLDEWLDFSKPGNYRLTVRYDGAVRAAAGVNTDDVIRNQTFAVTVLPRDEGRLRRKALFLLQQMETGTGDRRLEEQELLHMFDREVIPYWERALAETLSSDYYDPLVRIGVPEARKALERLAQSPIDFVATSAKAALARIKRQVLAGDNGPS